MGHADDLDRPALELGLERGGRRQIGDVDVAGQQRGQHFGAARHRDALDVETMLLEDAFLNADIHSKLGERRRIADFTLSRSAASAFSVGKAANRTVAAETTASIMPGALIEIFMTFVQ